MIEKYLKGEEKIILSLRSLYSKYGYLPYKMNKFEEYDLYAKNKDFLVSDSVITFTGTNGKLLALKPDVTLSIIKNATEEKGTKNKVFYSENVYRISGGTREYKEIMQMGLECIGDIDLYDTYEVISLAKNSLESISSDFVLEISHMGVVSGVLSKITGDEEFCKKALECIEKKSTHTLLDLCQQYNISKPDAEAICSLASLYGTPDSVLQKLSLLEKSYDISEYTSELKEIWSLLEDDTNSDKIRFDFSIVNDMNYYNGIVINGFINGICECVLFGGNYDKLLYKMGKKCSGVGFAIYTDLLSSLNERPSEYDVDTLVIYNESTSPKKLKETVDSLILEGKSVSAQKSAPKKLRYKEKIDI
ncbi:MAG: ATP phosphoribosyltransferase regulatory subunit [Clostridia bacterium]|nr:ATP phosphoribosyltransferase regulatory subunit [Clostridia bacterium]